MDNTLLAVISLALYFHELKCYVSNLRNKLKFDLKAIILNLIGFLDKLKVLSAYFHSSFISHTARSTQTDT